MKQVLTVFRDELRRIFVLRPVFSVLIVGSAFYAVFYPQPYLNEALRNVPIAVVDADGTSASRELARRIDVTSDIAVAMVLPDVVSAEREVFARKIFGILAIPKISNATCCMAARRRSRSMPTPAISCSISALPAPSR